MNKTEKIKQLLAELFLASKKLSFVDVKTSDGCILRTADEALKQGSTVTIVGADGTETAPADGDYTTEDGSVATIKSGVVEVLTPASSDANQPLATDATTAPTATPSETMATADNSAPVPAAAPQAEATETDGDMAQLLEIIKNITDRLSALEEKANQTKMSVEKLAAAPAATAFNANTQSKGTVGDYLKAHKDSHMSKVKANEERVKSLSMKKDNKSNGPKIDLGSFGKMSVSN